MPNDDLSTQRIQQIKLDAQRAQIAAAQRAALQIEAVQEDSEQMFQTWSDDTMFNPAAMARRFESLETRRKRTTKEEAVEKEQETAVLEVQEIDQITDEFSRKNPELQTRALQLLRTRISPKDTKEEILQKVLEMYPDPSLADEALDYLEQTSRGGFADEIRRAREDLNARYGREINAGKNIAQQAREFSQQGLGSPSGLRNLYRDVTGNPRDANTLFNELTTQFAYEKMKTVIDFLLHSMGGDLKSKGPSIDRGELHQLLSEARKLQGILGVFRFFHSRMPLILAAFERQGMQLPMRLTFEMLAKQFMRMIQERYPSADKILQLGSQLGLSEEIIAQIILLTQMRDGIRQIAPRLFRSDQHRQDLLNAFMDAIEELDERIEEEEEEEEEKEKEEGKDDQSI
jgi:type III secretion protein W